MRGLRVCIFPLLGGLMALSTAAPRGAETAAIVIDYPAEGSVFPPEIAAPTFLWRDGDASATGWVIEVTFSDGAGRLKAKSRGERMQAGEIDARCLSSTNEPPQLTPEQAASHTWRPDAATWAAIKKRSVERGATVTITGLREGNPRQPVSRGAVSIRTSKDPVGAPVFYRDVPLAPSETEKGVIKPLAAGSVPLIAWRLRNIAEPGSRLLLTGLHTCANCHSFSADGKTLGMDLDGPQNDKGLYAIAAVKPQTSIRKEDMIAWDPTPGREVAKDRLGFMSQVSPDGEHLLTGFSGAGSTVRSSYYVVNFKDYRFLQVFYPTRGVLAWYSRATGRRHPLPGADDPRYVQTDGVWSPDQKYIVFARAEARDPYPAGAKMAEYANDPNEAQIQYDLYRVPFNEGRGGQAEPIAGASQNGMSNTFPKVSPDGRWIVFVKCRNGQLMRPDSQLYIVPAQGGEARRMRCNTTRMNSWHSFSPNGRWMVFSSKARSPYTQMYLTHIDENGDDSPAILIENSTAANRAVNIPEFVNIAQDGLTKIEVPATQFYEQFDRALQASEKHEYEAAIFEWKKALELEPENVKARINLGMDLANTARIEEAIAEYKRAGEIDPANPESYSHLGATLARTGEYEQAIPYLEKALQLRPRDALALTNLGKALALTDRRLDRAIAYCQQAVEINSEKAEPQTNLAVALSKAGRMDEATAHFQKALELAPEFAEAHYGLGLVHYRQGKFPEALTRWRMLLRLKPNDLVALNQAAELLATSRDASIRNGAEAVELAERAVRLSGGREPILLDTLAAAYAEAGRFSDAVETGRRALELARQQNDSELAQALSAKISLYEAKTPFREKP